MEEAEGGHRVEGGSSGELVQEGLDFEVSCRVDARAHVGMTRLVLSTA